MNGCDMGMADPIMMAGALVGTVLVAILFLIAIALGVRALRSGPSGSVASSSARSELDSRYAHGEIDRGTYIAMRRDLES